MDAFTPMPRARHNTAREVEPGDFRARRSASLMSCMVSIDTGAIGFVPVAETMRATGARASVELHSAAGSDLRGRTNSEFTGTRPTQKISFKPNWICRDVVAVVVINPAEGLIAPLEKTVAFGVPKFGWFSTLKNSARNSRLRRSAIAVSLNNEASTPARPGPLYTPRPKSP